METPDKFPISADLTAPQRAYFETINDMLETLGTDTNTFENRFSYADLRQAYATTEALKQKYNDNIPEKEARTIILIKPTYRHFLADDVNCIVPTTLTGSNINKITRQARRIFNTGQSLYTELPLYNTSHDRINHTAEYAIAVTNDEYTQSASGSLERHMGKDFTQSEEDASENTRWQQLGQRALELGHSHDKTGNIKSISGYSMSTFPFSDIPTNKRHLTITGDKDWIKGWTITDTPQHKPTQLTLSAEIGSVAEYVHAAIHNAAFMLKRINNISPEKCAILDQQLKKLDTLFLKQSYRLNV